MPPSILIVDDEDGIRESLGSLLRDEGYEVASVASGEECLELTSHREFDLILLDVWLKKMDGIEVLSQIQSRDEPPVVIMISGHGKIEMAVRATKLGAFDFIEKPLSLERLLVLLQLFFQALDFLAMSSAAIHQVGILAFRQFTLTTGGREGIFVVHPWRVYSFFDSNFL